jgi:membrane protease YdiL (CAAX protease family)
MAGALACLYLVVMVLFSLAFLVDWVHSYVHVRKYMKYGIAVGAILVGFELLTLAVAPVDWASRPVFRVCACGMDFLKMVGFTSLGMYYCLTLGRPSFPLLLRRHVAAEMPVAQVPVAEAPAPDGPLAVAPEVAANLGDVAGTTPSEPSQEPAMAEAGSVADGNIVPPVHPAVVPRDAIAGALIVAFLGVVYSLVLFVLFSPRMSESMRLMRDVENIQRTVDMKSVGSSQAVVQAVLFLLLVALGEEIVFRLGVQSFLAKYLRLSPSRYWIAIVATTIIWTIGHAGVLEPAWVKLVQIFPMGLMLGWLCQHYGVESSILAHMVFNLALVFPSSSLVT